MIIGFTGTRQGMTDLQKDTLHLLLKRRYQPGDEFHHGNCMGADEEAALIAKEIGYKTIAHPSNLVSWTSSYISDLTLDPKPPLERNRDIVDVCDELYAAPKLDAKPKVLAGQGTWYTVNYAEQIKKPIYRLKRDTESEQLFSYIMYVSSVYTHIESIEEGRIQVYTP